MSTKTEFGNFDHIKRALQRAADEAKRNTNSPHVSLGESQNGDERRKSASQFRAEQKGTE